jgi:hypothetical protein
MQVLGIGLLEVMTVLLVSAAVPTPGQVDAIIDKVVAISGRRRF